MTLQLYETFIFIDKQYIYGGVSLKYQKDI